MLKHVSAAILLGLLAVCAPAQLSAPPNTGSQLKDTSMLKPPAGAKVALYEFEDMECPLCAHFFPIVHAAAEHYKIPLVRRDLPLYEIHVWSFDAAITARYLQDRVSPAVADSFRRDVFANQTHIAGRDDLARFTQQWFQSHGQAMPFVIDSTGACRKEVQADRDLADRMGLHHTPCLFVVTSRQWVEVTDINQLYRTIDQALAEATPAVPTRHRN